MLWKTYAFVFDKDFFFHDFCIAKNSSLWLIPKLNPLAIKEKCKEKICASHSYLRMPFFLVEAICNKKSQKQATGNF